MARILPGKLQKVAKIVRGLPEIVECDRVTGEDCFLARAHVQSVRSLERVIDEIIPYAMTNTSIIQSSPAERRLPPLRSASSQFLQDVRLALAGCGKSLARLATAPFPSAFVGKTTPYQPICSHFTASADKNVARVGHHDPFSATCQWPILAD